MKLPGSMKKRIKVEQEKIFEKMSVEDISVEEWDDLNEKYRVYSEMVKPSWKLTPDTLVVVAGNLMGILLILNFERLDIVRSKALSFVLKGRV
jgi:hypothetical protein